jgi:pimeloyl-ACP methyl ester carboxylesterase
MGDHSSAGFRTGPVRAVVRAGSSDTTYIRVGSGDSVTLVVADHDAPLSQTLFEGLGTRFRVIAPVTRPEASDFNQWLASFLDGLGITTTNLIVHEGLAANAIAFALLEAGRIDRLVIIAEQGLDGPPELGGALDDPADHASHPLLIVGASESADDVTERVARFLQDSGARLP